MSKIEKLQFDIAKYNRLAEVGVAIYKYNMVGEFMHNAMFYSHKSDKLQIELNQIIGGC